MPFQPPPNPLAQMIPFLLQKKENEQRRAEREQERAHALNLQLFAMGRQIVADDPTADPIPILRQFLPPGMELSGRTVDALGVVRKSEKKRANDQRSRGAAAGVLGQLSELAGSSSVEDRTEGQNTAINQGVAQLQSLLRGQPELMNQALTAFGRAQVVGDANRAAAARASEQAFATDLSRSETRMRRGARVERELREDNALRSAAREQYVNALVDAELRPTGDALAAQLGMPGVESGRDLALRGIENDEILGPDAKRERQIIETLAAQRLVTGSDARQVIGEFRKQGVHVPPRLARDFVADEPKAFQDIGTGLIVPGEPNGKNHEAFIAMTGVMDTLADMEGAIDLLAESGGSSALSGNIERLKSQVGPDANPFFAAYDTLRGQLTLLIGKARSGATLNEREIDLLDRAFTTLGELELVNGKVSKAGLARIRALRRELRAELRPRFGSGYDDRTITRLQNDRWQERKNSYREEFSGLFSEPRNSAAAADSILQEMVRSGQVTP